MNRCDVPPPGWFCTRERGHEGPCAAWPMPPAPRVRWGHVLAIALGVLLGLYLSSCGQDNRPEAVYAQAQSDSVVIAISDDQSWDPAYDAYTLAPRGGPRGTITVPKRPQSELSRLLARYAGRRVMLTVTPYQPERIAR